MWAGSPIYIIFYYHHWRELIFAFVFETVLFVFEYERPAFALLFALPPKCTPRDRTTFFPLFKIVARAGGAHGYASREGSELFDLIQYMLYLGGVGEKLLSLRFRIILVEFDLNQVSVFSEFRFDVVYVVDHPEAQIYELLLGSLRAIEVLVRGVRLNVQKGQASVILFCSVHRYAIYLVIRCSLLWRPRGGVTVKSKGGSR